MKAVTASQKESSSTYPETDMGCLNQSIPVDLWDSGSEGTYATLRYLSYKSDPFLGEDGNYWRGVPGYVTRRQIAETSYRLRARAGVPARRLSADTVGRRLKVLADLGWARYETVRLESGEILGIKVFIRCIPQLDARDFEQETPRGESAGGVPADLRGGYGQICVLLKTKEEKTNKTTTTTTSLGNKDKCQRKPFGGCSGGEFKEMKELPPPSTNQNQERWGPGELMFTDSEGRRFARGDLYTPKGLSGELGVKGVRLLIARAHTLAALNVAISEHNQSIRAAEEGRRGHISNPWAFLLRIAQVKGKESEFVEFTNPLTRIRPEVRGGPVEDDGGDIAEEIEEVIEGLSPDLKAEVGRARRAFCGED